MSKEIMEKWFELWEKGDFLNLPITEDFKHTSPFGTISGKSNYLDIVKANRDKFLGYTFNIHDSLYGEHKACVRYTGLQNNFRVDVSEWYTFKGNLISEVHSYYHIGEIKEDRVLDT